MVRRLSGFTPSGHLHLGNYLGAIRPVVDSQHDADTVALVVDLHALTVEHHPQRVRTLTGELAGMLLAAGVDPERTLCYVQSHVPEHTGLHYLLECATYFGEARRMIQFKEKSKTQPQVRLSLLTYPVLMAADILLHDIDEVPVGEDQTQHVELARDIAVRFNNRYGEIFVVPKAVNPPVAARVMDLADPTAKMGKSSSTDAGVLYLLDPPEVLRRKVMRAVTDSGSEVTGSEVRYEPGRRLGVANLLEILAACTGYSGSAASHPSGSATAASDGPAALAGLFRSYGELKAAVADSVIATVRPLQARYADLRAEPGYVDSVLADGAERARERVAATVRRARDAIGLLPPLASTGPRLADQGRVAPQNGQTFATLPRSMGEMG
jgi:tryptophanyl-tRNA synthetase